MKNLFVISKTISKTKRNGNGKMLTFNTRSILWIANFRKVFVHGACIIKELSLGKYAKKGEIACYQK